MAELKKNLLRECPFCGGEAVLDREDIFCDNCHVSLKINDRLYCEEAETYAEAKEQTIEAWNTRVTEAEIRNKTIDELLNRLESSTDDFISINGYLTGAECKRLVYATAEQLKGE